jgi:hypothetical protein
MSHKENIPSEIFDWINTLPFEALTIEQRQQVLLYFTQEEYIDMVRALQMVQQTTASSKQRIKADLFNRMEQKYPSNNKLIGLNKLIPLWQAAAVLLMLTGLIYVGYSSRLQQMTVALNGQRDTVYLERLIKGDVVKITDTIYATSKVKKATKLTTNKVTVHQESVVWEQQDISIQSLKDIDAPANRTKRNSVLDDSLVRNYRFTTL